MGQQWPPPLSEQTPPQTPPPEQKSQGSAVPGRPGVNSAQAQQENLPPPVRFENSIPNLIYTGFWPAIGLAAMPIIVTVSIITVVWAAGRVLSGP